jgi:hypothetical protein
MKDHSSEGASILTSIVTGFVALVPGDTFNYLEKLASVFLLAVVAELGRRLVTMFFTRKGR